MPSQDTLAQRLDIIRQPVIPARRSPGQPELSGNDEYLYHREQEDCHDR